MTQPSIKTKVARYLLRFTYVQLFITLISLPILAWWGLTLSWLTLLGNLLFAPVLSIFLGISSLIFFTELIGIPNNILAYALELLTSAWLWILSFADKTWLIALPKPPLWWCIAVPAAAVCCVVYNRSLVHATKYLAIVLASALLILKIFYVTTSGIIPISCGKQHVYLVCAGSQRALIDTGATAQLTKPESWVNYTLLPTLRKTCGSSTIDYYCLLRPTPRTLSTANEIVAAASVRNVYIPYWDDTAPKSIYRIYRQLTKTCRAETTLLNRFGKKRITIAMPHTTTLTLKQQKIAAPKNNNTCHEAEIKYSTSTTTVLTANTIKTEPSLTAQKQRPKITADY